MNVFFNASPLMGPKTGIGQYCLQLMLAMRQLPEIQSHYFYNGQWSDVLRESPPVPQLGRKSLIRSIAERMPRTAYALFHQRNARRFVAGIAPQVPGVYHEPNFLTYRCKLPTVVTVHDLSILRYPETHPKYRVAIMGKRIVESACRADRVITDSEYVRQEVISEFKLPPERVVSVLLAASEMFAPVSGEALDRVMGAHGLQAGRYVLAVGTLEPRKNLGTVIKAYAQLPEAFRREFPFVIAGMRGWRLEDFDRETASMIASGQIRQLGFVPDEDLPALYSGARVFVYPSLYEGFGLPPLEAMACGAAVIVSDRSSLPEVVGDAGIKLDALDAEGLSEAMRSIMESDELRADLGRRGIARASTFSWERCASQTLDVYRSVLR